MNWEAIAAIGQVLGSVAVFVTLGYLALQVRHAREEMQRSVVRARLDGSRELFLATATHSQLSSALTRLSVLSGGSPLPFQQYATALGVPDAEARQLNSFMWAVWQNFHAAIESAERLSPGVRKEFDSVIHFFFTNEGLGEKWYELMKERLNPDAVRYVDKLLAR